MQPLPEFSRPIPLAALAAPTHRRIEATEAERLALARRFDLVELRDFHAEVMLRPLRGGRMIRLEGRLEAVAVQTCVVTLEPVESEIRDDFVAVFAEPGIVVPTGREVDLAPDTDEEDDPEPIVGDAIDIGEVAAQHLSLAIDPYPRRPGAAFVAKNGTDDGAESPFNALASLTRRP